MAYADPGARNVSEMSDNGKKWTAEREKLMAQTEAANIQKVASNQNDNVQIDTMQPGEVQIDTMQKLKELKDDSFNQQNQSVSTQDQSQDQSFSTLDQSMQKPKDDLEESKDNGDAQKNLSSLPSDDKEPKENL